MDPRLRTYVDLGTQVDWHCFCKRNFNTPECLVDKRSKMDKPKIKKSRRVPAKKVSRACVHCRTAHITCDENRPCTRCVKKGLSDSCVDAPRKKKKYLEDALLETETESDVGISITTPTNQSMIPSRSLPTASNQKIALYPSHIDTNGVKNTNDNNFIYNQSPSGIRNTSLANSQMPNMNMMLPSINLPPVPSLTPRSNPQSPLSTTTNHQPQMQSIQKRLSNAGNNTNNFMDLKRMHMNASRRATPPNLANGFFRDNLLNVQSPNKDNINFLSSAADSEYAILGNIIDQSMFHNNHNTSPKTSFSANSNVSTSTKHDSPALSNTNSDDFDIMHYQPLMKQGTESPSVLSNGRPENDQPGSPFMKPLQPIQMEFGKRSSFSEPFSSTNNTETNNKTESLLDHQRQQIQEHQQKQQQKLQQQQLQKEDALEDDDKQLQYSDLYPDEPQCDVSTNQYFIGTMSTIDGVKTHTFPEVVKQISKFKRKFPKKFRERNRKSAISFSIGIHDDVVPEIESNDLNEHTSKQKQIGSAVNSQKCGLMYNEPSEIYEKVKLPFAYVKPYHDLNLYLKSRFSKEDLIQVSKSIAEYRPSFIAGMIKLKEDDLIFAEQCFQRTLLEYDSYIGISGTPTMVWRRTSQIAYVGDEFCILTGWSKENLVGKSTFAVEIMDDKSCVEYFKIFSKIAFGDTSGETMTECTLLTPKGENIRTSSTWTLKRDVFGIPMMIVATFLPILT